MGSALPEALIPEVAALVSNLEEVTEVDNRLAYSLDVYPALLRP